MKVLITGGAGFIGTHLALKLAARGADVTVLDNLSAQVHGEYASFAAPLQKRVRCVKGDVCDASLLSGLLSDRELVVHLAAETGTGQSMYSLEQYSRTNVHGTSVLLELLVNQRPRLLRKVIVASSRAVYGEGLYRCPQHGAVQPRARTAATMARGNFEPGCPTCGDRLELLPTSEATPCEPSSFYGLTKQVQEQMVLMFGAALDIDAFALRFQNVYGPGQSLVNPYTGILAIFSNLVRQRKPLNIFEDGLESRDFVFVDDVVEATLACANADVRGVRALNVGSGVSTTVLEVAHAIRDFFQIDVPIHVTGTFRLGDIRHNVADISALRKMTGFSPKWSFREGLEQFLRWASLHNPADAGFESSLRELRERGMLGAHT